MYSHSTRDRRPTYLTLLSLTTIICQLARRRPLWKDYYVCVSIHLFPYSFVNLWYLLGNFPEWIQPFSVTTRTISIAECQRAEIPDKCVHSWSIENVLRIPMHCHLVPSDSQKVFFFRPSFPCDWFHSVFFFLLLLDNNDKNINIQHIYIYIKEYIAVEGNELDD